jgi:phosphopantothenoylcysteine synthetase/decarboxylase
MWEHAATQQNVATLKSRGVHFVGPDVGLLSCGYEGTGRLTAVEQIAQLAVKLLG